jgi:hypothetical protein
MIKIETLEIAGFVAAVQALRLPFGKECRSEAYSTRIEYHLDKLLDGCSEEMNGAPSLRTTSVCCIHDKDLHLMQVLVKRGDEHAKCIRGIVAYAEIEAPVYWWCELETYRAGHERLSSESTMHVDCKGLSGEELVKAKSEIPMGKMLKKIDFFSYKCLRNIVKQRKGHRLPEWETFINWVKSLPFAEELILVGIEEKNNEK